VPLAAAALADGAALVRWRAARILGELGEGSATLAALKQALHTHAYAYADATAYADADAEYRGANGKP